VTAPTGLNTLCASRIDELAPCNVGVVVPRWPGLCAWWGTLTCSFCEIGGAIHGECSANCRDCKIRRRGGCPCVDGGLRDVLDADGLWWPGSERNAPPRDWLDWQRRNGSIDRWHEVYGRAIAAERQAARQYRRNLQAGNVCELCGEPVSPGHRRCTQCRWHDPRWSREASILRQAGKI